jgi:hypothetical protein
MMKDKDKERDDAEPSRTLDPYAMFETRIGVSLDLDCDLTTKRKQLEELLDRLERDLADFWKEEGLPDRQARFWRVNGGPWLDRPPDSVSAPAFLEARWHHPAQDAPEGSWLWLSWQHWGRLQNLRKAIVENDRYQIALCAFALGLKHNEIVTARQFGRNVGDGRQLAANRAAGGRASKRKEDLWEEILAADDDLRGRHPSMLRSSRAEILAERFPRSASSIRKRLPK